ncbi:hypothetical protein [Actinoallomurus iriomotensis]|uniref:DUF202 domain-containing protein n=1 Tax=Actinoallomurus iriomotensis TaxID=478107 RepID=A0A9W6RYJ8_9ACTN|nr:hypothetical protein [Actinoallomurus iriomotensis]GLY84510.1 hypothetical protein Airi02_024390 [Actinoallomurus iriomotensis]
MSSGLQSQRTELAWLRITLSAWTVTAIAARVDLPVGMFAAAGPVALTLIAYARRRRLREEGLPPALAPTEAVPLAAACVLIALAAALLL